MVSLTGQTLDALKIPAGDFVEGEEMQMFSKFKERIKDKSEEIFEQYTPKIQSLLKNEIGVNARQALENDEMMKTALKAAHKLLLISHPFLRPVLSQDRFVNMGLSNRDKLLNWRDPRPLKALPEQQPANEEIQNTESETAMPRDYLREASSTIFQDKVSLAELFEVEPDQAIGNLLRALNYEEGLSSAMIRKGAAYALGQIGESMTLDILKERHKRETALGVKEALVASMTAIKLAPAGAGHSQLERRQIIQNVYEGQRHPDWS